MEKSGQGTERRISDAWPSLLPPVPTSLALSSKRLINHQIRHSKPGHTLCFYGPLAITTRSGPFSQSSGTKPSFKSQNNFTQLLLPLH